MALQFRIDWREKVSLNGISHSMESFTLSLADYVAKLNQQLGWSAARSPSRSKSAICRLGQISISHSISRASQ
jgi:hypothetical protein